MQSFSSDKGFSLVEMMIALALIGILAAIAIPLYNSYQLKSGRSEGTAALLDLSQQAERFFVRNNTYTGALPERSISSSGRYSIAFEVFPVDEVEGLSFRLTATPQGAQSKDTDCQRIIINNLGQRTAFDSPDPPGGGQDNSNLCW